MTPEEWFAQTGYRCRLEWGWQGAQSAAKRGDLLVVVDVLSFSPAVATVVHRGGSIRPCITQEEAQSVARQIQGEVAVPRQEVPHKGRFSLSPISHLQMEAGTKVVLPSP